MMTEQNDVLSLDSPMSIEELARTASAQAALLRLFFEQCPVSVAMFDGDMRCLAMSRRFRDSYHLTEEPVIGRDYYELFPDIPERWKEVHRRCLAGAVERCDEDRLVRADGSEQWERWEVRPWQLSTGEIGGIIVFSEEITEQRLAQQALRDSEADFRSMADHAPVMIWVTAPDGACTYLNRKWYELTGQTEVQGLGLGWLDAVHPEDRERALAVFAQANARREAFRLEYRLRHHSGEYRWYIDSAAPRWSSTGEFVGYIGSIIDITERKHAEQALQDADQRKDEFLAMLAHELRNPLAPIRNGVEILRLLGQTDERSSGARAMIERQVGYMSRLVDDLLDVSRIARGKIQLRHELCDLSAIVRQTADDYSPLLEANGLSFDVQVPTEPSWLHGDPTRLAQVFANVLQNAHKFTEPGGHVLVTMTTDRQGSAVIRICDTGRGMEPDLLARVFEPFSQADRSLDRSHGGLGLGLTLVQGLVELHGGEVHATSAGPGQGTEIEIRLPVQLQPVDASEPARADGASTAARRVLVIEDNRDAAESMQMLLQLLGHEIELAGTGAAGLARAREFRPHVILCDIGLPDGMDGYAVARALRQDPALAHTYLVALTGYGQHEDRMRARAAGFDLHLVKPVELAVLQRLLATR